MCEQVTLVGVEPLQDSLAVVDSASFTTPTEAGHAQLRLAVVSCNKVSLRPFAARLHRLYILCIVVCHSILAECIVHVGSPTEPRVCSGVFRLSLP